MAYLRLFLWANRFWMVFRRALSSTLVQSSESLLLHRVEDCVAAKVELAIVQYWGRALGYGRVCLGGCTRTWL